MHYEGNGIISAQTRGVDTNGKAYWFRKAFYADMIVTIEEYLDKEFKIPEDQCIIDIGQTSYIVKASFSEALEIWTTANLKLTLGLPG